MTGTTFGIQAAAASQTVSMSSSTNAASTGMDVKMVGICGALAAGVFAAMLAL